MTRGSADICRTFGVCYCVVALTTSSTQKLAIPSVWTQRSDDAELFEAFATREKADELAADRVCVPHETDSVPILGCASNAARERSSNARREILAAN
jgi:hypothetical protein